jgi:hypothetical protein
LRPGHGRQISLFSGSAMCDNNDTTLSEVTKEEGKKMNNIPTIGRGERKHHSPTSTEIKAHQWNALSQMWQAYGELISKSDHPDRKAVSEEAFRNSAKYISKLINFAEEKLEEEQG